MPLTGVPATIAAIYNTNAAQSIATGVATIVDFEDKVADTHNAVTTGAAWKFTAPASGFYQVSVQVWFQASSGWVDTESGYLLLRVNAVTVVMLDYKDSYGSASNVYMQLNGTTLVYLDVGDYVNVMVTQSSGAALALYADARYNRIAIVRV